MSWAKLLRDRHVTKLPPSKAELDNLRSIVARSLRDAAGAKLSADAQFVMAYDAARTLSLMIVPRSAGGHYNTFLDLVLMGRNFGTLNDADFLQKNQVGARSPQPVPYLQKDFAAPVRPEALMGIQRQHPNSCR